MVRGLCDGEIIGSDLSKKGAQQVINALAGFL